MKPPVILVLGGGFSGAAFATHLLRAARDPFELVIVEPREALGAGLAYGSAAPEHRINVPSDKMIVFREDPTHLTRWARAEGLFESDPVALTPEGHHYSRRDDFARYVAALLDDALRGASPGSVLRHVRAKAVDVAAAGPGYHVRLDDGASLEGDAVVVTASHETPAFPWPVDEGTDAHAGLVRDPWLQLQDIGVERMRKDSTIVIAGTGLTMCDVVVSLVKRGFGGDVLAISRRALLPRTHERFADGFDLLVGQSVPTTSRALLRCVREAVRRADDWREALDAVRFMLPVLWQALSPRERRRAVRWLRPFWDVHRFRMAPQVDALLRGQLQRGALRIAAGRVARIGSDVSGRLAVHWQARGDAAQRTRCAAFVNCTGPTADPSRVENPLIQALLASGLAVADPAGVGLDCDADGRLRGREGSLAEHLCVAGPLARAAIAEVTGVPEASAHTRRVAERLAADPALRCQAALASVRQESPTS
jgi:uncharacterized NAD(P)/FAD-binding protein YdhS